MSLCGERVAVTRIETESPLVRFFFTLYCNLTRLCYDTVIVGIFAILNGFSSMSSEVNI